jgi:hypothetical protein
MALAKATTNKMYCTDPIALDPVFLAPRRQANFYKARRSLYQLLPRHTTLYNPFTPLTAVSFFSRVPFVIRKFHGLLPIYIGMGKRCVLA